MHIGGIRAAMLVAGLAAGLTLAQPPDLLEASTCGAGKSECTKHEACLKLVFFEACATVTSYWPEETSDDDKKEITEDTAPVS